jgi:hypothetical protein
MVDTFIIAIDVALNIGVIKVSKLLKKLRCWALGHKYKYDHARRILYGGCDSVSYLIYKCENCEKEDVNTTLCCASEDVVRLYMKKAEEL